MTHSPWRQLDRPVTGDVREFRVTKTRPVGTTDYVAGAAYIEPFRIDEACRPGRSAYLIGGSIQTSKGDSVQVFRMHLYSKAPEGFTDGVPFTTPKAAERATYLGSVEFLPLSRIGTGADAYVMLEQEKVPIPLVLPDGALHIALQGTLLETPESGQVFVLRLLLDRN